MAVRSAAPTERVETRPHPRACMFFVSTTLGLWTTDEPERFARDFQINDTVYRRLDPEYYAWLRSKMAIVNEAARSGQLDAAIFEEMRGRFNKIHEWAVGHFGEAPLLKAVRVLNAGEYQPPVVELVRPPKSSSRPWREGRPSVPVECVRDSGEEAAWPEVAALVDAIGEQAMALGWKRERLYGLGRRRFGPDRGLVCFLKPGDRIGEVTAQSIEIIHPLPSEVRHRFYNPDVDQPWIKKIARAPQENERMVMRAWY